MIFIVSFLLIGIVYQQKANAQLTGLTNFMTMGTSDVNKLLTAYLKPLANSFGADMNSGWYSTAKPHKLLGFDLTLSMSVAITPASDNSFNLSNLGLSTNCVFAKNTYSPSFTGSSTGAAAVNYNLTSNGHTINVASFTLPSGTGDHFIPLPMLQAGIGLPFETEIDVRYVPNLPLASSENVQLEGLGIKHSIKQYIPFIKYAPFFHLSIFAGYTIIKENTGFSSFTPSDLGSSVSNKTTGISWANQSMGVQIKAFTGDLVASFDIPLITFYAGIGFGVTDFQFNNERKLPNTHYCEWRDGASLINIIP